MNAFAKVLGIIFGIIGILYLQSVAAFKIYQERIPNGDKIPDPCLENTTWNGVGHKISIGGGTLNPFGTHFKRFRKRCLENLPWNGVGRKSIERGTLNPSRTHFKRLGKIWGKTLCEKDSDGDGRTNGEELGDPDCTWSVGNTPNKTRDISHPGICEPITSEKCKSKNSWLDCSYKEFKCDAFKEKGVKTLRVRLFRRLVPAKETVYMCMNVRLPTDGDYHIIGETPIIDNDYVLHHIVLFGCQQPINMHWFPYPYRCGMEPLHGCKDVLSLWSYGSKGHCGSPHAGFRMGIKGYKYAAIQIHWNNPEKRRGYIDSSGLVLYYTPNLRPYDAGVLTIGQINLAIPPYQENFEVTATCDGHCSDTILTSNIYVVESVNHMHYLGKAEKVELFRNNKFLQYVTNDANYDYDSPVTHLHETPIEILKGDELKTTCTFQSNNTNTTTYYGEDTAAEMCFAFLHYYPKQNLINNYCLSYRSLPMCELYGNNTLLKTAVIRGCNVSEVLAFTKGEMGYFVFGVLAKCQVGRCVPDCIPIIELMLQHPCFQGDMIPYMREAFSRKNKKLSALYFSKLNPCMDFLTYCPNCTAANLSTWYSDNTTTTSNTTVASSVMYTTSDSTTNKPKTSNYTQRITTKSTSTGKTTTSGGMITHCKSKVTGGLIAFQCFIMFIVRRIYRLSET